MTPSLPERPSLDYLRKQAKRLLKRHKARNPEACPILRHLHRFADASDEAVLSAEVSLVEVQFAIATEYGFKDWDTMRQHVETLEATPTETVGVQATDVGSPWPELRRAIVAEAIALGASDSHLEWNQGRLGVRQRVDGALRPSKVAIGEDQQQSVVDGFKMMAALDTTVHDEPQIGYCMCDVGGRQISMRVSVVPYRSGESVAARYMLQEPGLFNVHTQGWADDDLSRLRQWINRPSGLIVVTGPAGSGRTTTIYGILKDLGSRGDRKIITAEDPVEYDLEGILQQQVGHAEDISYAQAIVSQTRQDPDVMFVGECRDIETLEGVLTVATTGHLVLTTMHANDGPTCLRRILDLGIKPYRLAGAIVGVLAQRLVRKVCQQCREPQEPPAWARESLPDLPAEPLFKGKGCEACQNTGFHGRTVIAEMFEVDDAVRLLIARNASVEEFREQAVASGTASLRAAGLAKAAAGLTTVDEVLRVCPT